MKAVLLLALAAVALAGTLYQPHDDASFCGKYTKLVFVNNTAANQNSLLGFAVDATIFGCTPGALGGACSGTSLGLLQLPTNAPYFNGNNPYQLPNYTDPSQSAALTALRTKLINFFAVALGCSLAQPAGVYILTPAFASLYGAHHRLSISGAAFGDFIGSATAPLKGLLGALVALGLNTLAPLGDGTAGTELGYLAALVGSMGVNPAGGCTGTGGILGDPCALSVCSDTALGCPTAVDFYQFVYSFNTGAHAWAASFVPEANQFPTHGLALGGKVNYRWGGNAVHRVNQADATFTVDPNGFSSGATSVAEGTYTRQFAVAGAYYVVCGQHPTAMRTTIVVQGSTAAGLTASLTIVAAAIVAALASRQ